MAAPKSPFPPKDDKATPPPGAPMAAPTKSLGPKPAVRKPGSEPPGVEIGGTGLKQYGGYVREEWLKTLQGRRGMLVLREMRDNDGIIGAIFFAIEMLMRGVDFRIEPVTAGAPGDQEAADFVNSCMGDLDRPWADLVSELMSFLPFGWAVHERVYKIRGGDTDDHKTRSKYDDGLIGWRKFAGRSQDSLLKWVYEDGDKGSGDPIAMQQLLPNGGTPIVPLAKCLHITTTRTKSNPEGRSVMRNAYLSWFRKTRIEEIEAIGIERDLTGIPVAWIPLKLMLDAASTPEKAQYAAWKKLVRETSRNEQEGLVIPLDYDKDGNKRFDLTLLTTAGRRQTDTTTIVNRYDQRMAACVLADFITLGTGSTEGVGSFAQSAGKINMFAAGLSAFLDIITSGFNDKQIPELLAMNSMQGQCKMTHGEITQKDLMGLAEFLAKLTAFIMPDPELEAHLRDQAGLPAPPEGLGATLQTGGEDTDDPFAEEGEGGDQAAEGEEGAPKMPFGRKPGAAPPQRGRVPPGAPRPNGGGRPL